MRQLAVPAAVLVGENGLGRCAGVVHRGQAGGVEQLRHVAHAVAGALALLLRRERLALANAAEHVPGIFGDAAVQLAVLLEEPAVRRVGRGRGDAGQLERLGVIEGRVAAAMRHRHGMIRRCLVEILPRQRPIQLRIVEHEPVDPDFRRGGLRLAPDGRLDFAHRPQVRVDAVQLLDAAGMAVRVDESGRHRHPLRVENLRAPAGEVADIRG